MWIRSDKFVISVLCLLTCTCCCFCWAPGKVCTGTNFELRPTGHAGSWSLQRYIRMYENCTYVNGNLEITYLDNDSSYDLSFLSTIREVSGYVVIAHVRASVIPLRSLRVIRGQSLLRVPNDPSNDPLNPGYGLYVANCVGLHELQLTALREIMAGSVMFDSNYDLCYVNTIDWSDILTGQNSTVYYPPSDPSQPAQQCGECDESCDTEGERHCWGSGPDMCQTLIRQCDPLCAGSCYGPGSQCCSRECVGGCSGPQRTQCYACENFIDDGECVIHCPPLYIYNPVTQMNEPNPDAKYQYGIMCVTSCPDPSLIDSGSCVSDCSDNEIPSQGRCVPCEGDCPKVCRAPEQVDGDNIANLTGCAIIHGVLRIIHNAATDLRPVSRQQLEVLASVKEITGALVVKYINDPEIPDLSFLRNLEVIDGRTLENGQTALLIVRTNLQSLGLASLQSIPHGRVFIGLNNRLCGAETVNWTEITGRENATRLKRNGQECVHVRGEVPEGGI